VIIPKQRSIHDQIDLPPSFVSFLDRSIGVELLKNESFSRGHERFEETVPTFLEGSWTLLSFEAFFEIGFGVDHAEGEEVD